jgi:hypothetical protein
LAEVYTNKREVNAMLDLVRDESYRIDSRFLEPSCGNGNFLEEILLRKLHSVSAKYSGAKSFEFFTLVALGSTYGVDIDSQNVKETRERLSGVVRGVHASRVRPSRRSDDFDRAVEYVLATNIIQGDMLNRVSDIQFTEFFRKSRSDVIHELGQRRFRLIDMMNTTGEDLPAKKPEPIWVKAPEHYTKIWETISEGK